LTAHGTYGVVDDRPALRFERRLRHPVERVWRALTDGSDLARWFPDRVEGDVRPGARLRFSSDAAGASEGTVLVAEPPHRLAFSWYAHELRFELVPDGEHTVLRLTALLEQDDMAARDAAGWHVCLDRLQDALDGGDGATPDWAGYYDQYRERGFPTGAPTPGT
jgi:uncharacterized protein YndB with AHSA1/START domain